jgi:Na+-translocating ferredoxin:NAD+ oxidoreductase RnfD subunit
MSTLPATSPSSGPPWIGPVTPRTQYEHHWLWVHGAGCVAALVFFGWRALLVVVTTALLSLLTFIAVLVIVRMVRRQWGSESLMHVLNMGLLTGLSTPLMSHFDAALVAAIFTGIACHFLGPTRRVRIHPVALVQVMLTLLIPLTTDQAVQAVLAPNHVVVGNVQMMGTPIGGSKWIDMRVARPFEAIARPEPQRVMLTEQRELVRQSGRMVKLMKEGELPRMIDLLIGATPGPVGATSAAGLIIAGLLLIYRRVGRWPVALVAVLAAVAALALIPINDGNHTELCALVLSRAGWRVCVTYLAYQLLASPLLLIVLIFAPLTMPRTSAGRLLYAAALGSGVVLIRWFIPQEGMAYIPLITLGLLCPLLDRLRSSRFVSHAS